MHINACYRDSVWTHLFVFEGGFQMQSMFQYVISFAVLLTLYIPYMYLNGINDSRKQFLDEINIPCKPQPLPV